MKTLLLFCSIFFFSNILSCNNQVKSVDEPIAVTGVSTADTDHSDTGIVEPPPIVPSNSGFTRSGGRRVPQYKKDHANEVFRRLKRALGLSESDPPFFELRKALPDDKFSSAMIDFNKSKIYLDQPSYDICATQFEGADTSNALAVYLGHEIAHFHLDHQVQNHFAWEFRVDLADVIFEKVKTKHTQAIKDTVANIMLSAMTSGSERDADKFGGFLAYLAGYKTTHIARDVLQKTYDQFGINKNPENKANYPTFEERIEIVTETQKDLENLIIYFETGNMLIALKKYEDALLYYKEVLKAFQSREVYNNIGFLYLKTVIDKLGAKKVKYFYPAELDINFRGDKKGKKDTVSHLLNLAIESFESAIAKDFDYPVAVLNKGCAHTLLAIHTKDELLRNAEFAKAEAAVLDARLLADNNLSEWKKPYSDTYILEAIIAAEKGDSLLAIEHFNTARNFTFEGKPVDPTLADVNLDIHKHPEHLFIPKTINSIGSVGLNVKNIEGKNKHRIKQNMNTNNLKLNLKKNTNLYYDKLAHSRVYYHAEIINADLGKFQSSFFHMTDMDYNDPVIVTKGSEELRMGDGRKEIEKIFGKAPDSEIQLGNGAWLKYKSQEIILQLDTEGKITRWCLYHSEKN